MNTFDASDYQRLHSLVFRDDWAGYKPTVREAPNGDGHVDRDKRYAHVAAKYFQGKNLHRAHAFRELASYLDLAMMEAREQCVMLGAPEPGPDTTLRVLEYPPGASGGMHTDFDLFTLNLWRNVPNPGLPPSYVHMGELGELFGLGKATPHYTPPMPREQQSIVLFIMPHHEIEIPSLGITVGEWVAERIARSRVPS